MPKVATPDWLAPPQTKWLACTVAGLLEPEGYAVQIRVNGHSVAAVVPQDSVDFGGRPLPAEGRIRVVVLAEVAGDLYLAELPAAPLNGTRRVTLEKQLLQD